MKKPSTLEPYFSEKCGEAIEAQLRKKLNYSGCSLKDKGPSALVRRSILGYAAACSFQKNVLPNVFEVVIN